MPRVVPSQVVQVIDRIFPWAKDQRDVKEARVKLDISHVNQAAAIIKLIDNILDELFVLEADDYAKFVIATSVTRNQIILWNTRGGGPIDRIPGLGQLNPITIIRKALALCPDEAPYTDTEELEFIDDDKLRNSMRQDISAIRRALINQEWKAVTILSGAVIEALLLWTLQKKSQAQINEAVDTLIENNVIQQRPSNDIEAWNLFLYIQVSSHLTLISEETKKQTELAKDYRNLIHPGRAKRLGQICDRATAYSAVAGVEHVVRDLK